MRDYSGPRWTRWDSPLCDYLCLEDCFSGNSDEDDPCDDLAFSFFSKQTQQWKQLKQQHRYYKMKNSVCYFNAELLVTELLVTELLVTELLVTVLLV